MRTIVRSVFWMSMLLAGSRNALALCANEGSCSVCKTSDGSRGQRCCLGGHLTPCEIETVKCRNVFCGEGQVCSDGKCACPSGTKECNGACTDPSSDAHNCGGCGNACAGATPFCKNAVCAACQDPFTSCNGVCRDLATDSQNCFACGKVCPNGTVCQSGVCVAEPGTSGSNSGATGNLPLDLVWNRTDVNGLPLNPDWRAHSNPAMLEGDHVDLTKACAQCFKEMRLCDQVSPDDTVCYTTQAMSTDPACWQGCTSYPIGSDNNVLCQAGQYIGQSNGGGHLNWFPAAYEGVLRFGDYSRNCGDIVCLDDDDYNFEFRPSGGAGLAGRDSLHSEISAGETVDRFHSAWWQTFHDAVNVDNTAGGASVPCNYALLIGLVEYDLEHNVHTELHPVYAMAIHLTSAPSDDRWAIFAQNWGSEGFCGSGPHPAGLRQITFRLPGPPGATAVNEAQADFRTDSYDATVSYVYFDGNGSALITMKFGPPEEDTQVNGWLRLSWAVPPGTRGLDVCPSSVPLTTKPAKEVELSGTQLLTPAQRQQLKAALPPAQNRDKSLDMIVPKRVPYAPAPSGGVVIVRDRVIPDVVKQTNDRQIQKTMCAMLESSRGRPAYCGATPSPTVTAAGCCGGHLAARSATFPKLGYFVVGVGLAGLVGRSRLARRREKRR